MTNYAAHEQLVIDLPLSVTTHHYTGHAAIAENGLDTVVLVSGMPIVILKGFVELDDLDLRFVARSFADDAALYEGPTQDAAADATVIEDSDRLIVVSEFDLQTDKLEIGEGRDFQLEDAQDGAGTIVVVDGQPIFLVQGVLPAQMADAVV